MLKFNLIIVREYILIFLTATIFLLESTSNTHSKENIFVVEDLKIEGIFDKNFSRDKIIEKAFSKSFIKLLSNILLLEDQKKLKNLNLKEIKKLIYSFKILDEKFKQDKYLATFNIVYNDDKIKKLFSKKNISFFEPINTTVMFFPILFIGNNIKIYDENIFYKKWITDNPNEETIKFILPLEDLDDILSINKIKDEIEKLDFANMAIQYNTQNYAVAIITHETSKLKIYLKTSLERKEYNENLLYNLENFDDENRIDFIITDLKIKILEMWKKANLINVPLPLNILIKFPYKNPKDLHNLEKTFVKINVINTYTLERFDIHDSFFRLNYYGDPKKLSSDFLKLNYLLEDNKGNWELKKIND